MPEKISSQVLKDTQDLLNELFEVVSSEESLLSGGDKHTKLGKGSEALQGLRETKVTFGNPKDKLIPLTENLFNDIGVELTEIHKRQMRNQFNYYYMTLTVSMRPERGAQFTRVECELDFGPKGKSEPIVETIFPKSEWREILRLGRSMTLAINGKLEWGMGIDAQSTEVFSNLPGHLRAKVSNNDELKGVIAIPDYTYSLGHSDIAATGEGNSECFWRIENSDLQKAQTVKFGIVFKVPQNITSIRISGVAGVEPDMKWLRANIRDVFGALQNRLQRIFQKKQLLIGVSEKWEIELPK